MTGTDINNMNYGSLTCIQPQQAPQPGLGHGKYKGRDFHFSAWPLSHTSLTHQAATLVTITIVSKLLGSLTNLMILFMRQYTAWNVSCWKKNNGVVGYQWTVVTYTIHT